MLLSSEPVEHGVMGKPFGRYKRLSVDDPGSYVGQRLVHSHRPYLHVDWGYSEQFSHFTRIRNRSIESQLCINRYCVL